MESGIFTPTESHFQRIQTKSIKTKFSKEELLVLLKQQDWLKEIQLSDDGQQIVAKNQVGREKINLEIKEETLTISSRSLFLFPEMAAIGSIKNIQRLEKLIQNASTLKV